MKDGALVVLVRGLIAVGIDQTPYSPTIVPRCSGREKKIRALIDKARWKTTGDVISAAE